MDESAKWQQANTPELADAGLEGGALIMAVRVDGGDVAGFPAAADTTQAIGNGIFSCSIGNAAGSGIAFFGIAGVAALRIVRRRRRR